MPFNKFYSRAGLPCWLSSKQSSFQCRRHEFNPWVRKFPFRKKWKPTPAFLPGKSHRQRSLVGYSPWGHRVEHDWVHTRAYTIEQVVLNILQHERNKFPHLALQISHSYKQSFLGFQSDELPSFKLWFESLRYTIRSKKPIYFLSLSLPISLLSSGSLIKNDNSSISYLKTHRIWSKETTNTSTISDSITWTLQDVYDNLKATGFVVIVDLRSDISLALCRSSGCKWILPSLYCVKSIAPIHINILDHRWHNSVLLEMSIGLHFWEHAFLFLSKYYH